MITVSVRSASEDDLERVSDLLRDARLPTDDLAAVFGDCFAVAIVDESIVGSAAVELRGEVGLFRSAAVGEAFRGQGIGDALVRNRIEWATARGMRELYLLTTTAGDYFPRFGFAPIPRDDAPLEIRQSDQFTSLCPSSATVMRLTLAALPEQA